MTPESSAWREIVQRAPAAIIGDPSTDRGVAESEQSVPQVTSSAFPRPPLPAATDVLDEEGGDVVAATMPERPWGNARARVWLLSVAVIVAVVVVALILFLVSKAAIADVVVGLVGLVVARSFAGRARTAQRERGLSPAADTAPQSERMVPEAGSGKREAGDHP
jgi:hypothetical protein